MPRLLSSKLCDLNFFVLFSVLRTVERVNLSGQSKSSDEWIDKLYEEFAKNKFFIHMAVSNMGNIFNHIMNFLHKKMALMKEIGIFIYLHKL